MLRVFKGEDQVEFIAGDGSTIRDGFILEFGDNVVDEGTIEISEVDQKLLLKWLINHADFI